MPEGAIYVGRPSMFGNPYHGATFGVQSAPELVVEAYREWLMHKLNFDQRYRDALRLLRGHDLVCWCPLDQPCHADMLLELANT